MDAYMLEDCYINTDKDCFTIGNNAIERKFTHFGLCSPIITDKKSGYQFFAGKDDVSLMLSIPFDIHEAEVEYDSYISDNYGLSQRSLSLKITYTHSKTVLTREMSIYPNLPFITQKASIFGATSYLKPEDTKDDVNFNGVESNYHKNKPVKTIMSHPDALDILPLNPAHLTLTSIQFFDQTDRNDCLVKEYFQTIYHRGQCGADGNMFIISDKIADQAIILVKEAPTFLCTLNRQEPDLVVSGNRYAQIIGSGIDRTKSTDEEIPLYGSTIGVGRPSQMPELYRSFYRAQYKGQPDRRSFIMSNTWGDRSQDMSVCHDFLMKEIDTAKQIGVDIVQIDDGWEAGITSNSKRSTTGVWENYYAENKNFWDVNEERFPQGLEPVAKKSNDSGISLGLWFSPDSSNDFKNWENDVETISTLYEKYNAEHFKLDGVKIRSKLSEKRYINFLESLSERYGGKIFFNQDITAEQRLGYFYEKQYGTLFVENRYTDWANYYPHNTLKNLWMLSKYIPTRKFLFELLNNRRNADKYGNDILAPANYDIDYEFACVMLANPLVWMEMSSLAEEDIEKLKRIITVYKKYRESFFDADIEPIGQRPDGSSFTGFNVKTGNGCGYLLLFREFTNEDYYEYTIPMLGLKHCCAKISLDLLISNLTDEMIKVNENLTDDGKLSVSFGRPRAYAFYSYAVKE